jgi:hypothetical protein
MFAAAIPKDCAMTILPRCVLATALAAGAVLCGTAQAETVSVPPFRSIELRGGGHVILRHGAEQRVILLKGSTHFTRFTHDRGNSDQLVIDACNDDCPSQYRLEVEVVTPTVDGVAVSGGGKIESESGFGHQGSIAAAVEGGGDIDVRSIDAAKATAAVSGGGAIRLRAERRLEAAVDGGGDIRYWGDPAVTSAIDGGGNVSRGG